MKDDRAMVQAVLERAPGAFERLVVQHQNTDPLLKVLQPSSAIPDSPQLLAARITFRLHVLQRRGFDVESLSKRQLVSVVNQLIRNAMKKMPA